MSALCLQGEGTIHVFLSPKELPHLQHTQEQTGRHSEGLQEPSSQALQSPQPLLPEQPLQKPKDVMQESKDQTKALGSFPSSSLHYLARAINFFLS